MIRHVIVKKGTYRDSISLLKVSKGVEAVEGVHRAAVVMATPLNKRVLSDVGFSGPDVARTATDDLVIAIEAEDGRSMEAALAETEKLLAAREAAASAGKMPESLSEAIPLLPGANLTVISVPGSYAKHEALQSLNAGLNVFLFSSNVSRRDERELKELATAKGLLMMGPDCGSSVINGVALGFGNSIRRGSVGIVSASGTGLQEVSTMIHNAGLGISQAIGTGGGDLSDQVGGITALRALELLEADPKTEVIVVVSKPPGVKTRAAVLARLRRMKKPAVVNFLGVDASKMDLGRHQSAATLEEAAQEACRLAGAVRTGPGAYPDESKAAYSEASQLSNEQRYVRGLFAGGTLCYEAQVVLTPYLGPIRSNAPLESRYRLDGEAKSRGNTCVDMGSEEFVTGRAHPMIDFTLRKMRILEEAKDPGTAVLLLDVELGIGSNPDPAGELAPAIAEAKAIAGRAGRHLSVVASIVGTDGDFQGLSKQRKALEGSGVIVSHSNAGAAAMAALIATRGEGPVTGGSK